MKIKQTVKQIMIVLLLSFGFSASFATPSFAATCAGVETSVVGCTQTGACDGGEAPFEGTEPKATDDVDLATAKQSYLDAYHHNYGKCKQVVDARGIFVDVEPNNSVERSGVWGLLLMVINILTAGIGVLAVAGIVYGSVLYASAGGSPEQVKKAMGIISNVVIGIVAYALMYALLNFLIPGGLFD